MSQSPHDDRELISFLKQYRPLPPPGTQKIETQLLARVAREPFPHRQRVELRWIIPITLAASLGSILAGSRWNQPSYQLTSNSAELETFMVNTWQGTTNESFAEALSSPVDSEWLLLGNLETQYVVSSP